MFRMDYFQTNQYIDFFFLETHTVACSKYLAIVSVEGRVKLHL